ncbi:RusA family crossover junction endodeoxyribonuclease [Singulisphaera sp. PoT]|uniref:RusA family crossover junction endodeoxyribonuclease n=1 Tax=Singulisphaera sp. PoT TaxID=3411797 RepID=UPI003BF50510
MHLEFILLGPPISNQSVGPNLTNWKARIRAEATLKWLTPKLMGHLKAIVINFHEGDKPSLDLDNMSKPILDEMQDIIYADDRQIRQIEISHVRIDAPFVVAGASALLVRAVQAGNQFVYVRLEDPVVPFPLPR